jgi:hypothetical protein
MFSFGRRNPITKRMTANNKNTDPLKGLLYIQAKTLTDKRGIDNKTAPILFEGFQPKRIAPNPTAKITCQMTAKTTISLAIDASPCRISAGVGIRPSFQSESTAKLSEKTFKYHNKNVFEYKIRAEERTWRKTKRTRSVEESLIHVYDRVPFDLQPCLVRNRKESLNHFWIELGSHSSLYLQPGFPEALSPTIWSV